MANTGYIYKLCCNDVTIDDVYVGSTKNHYKRKHEHKDRCKHNNRKEYNKYVYRFIRENGGWDNWEYVILETVQYNEKHELHRREREYIENLGATLNKTIPTRTKQEYNQANREKYLAWNKKYRDNNKHKAKEYQDKNKERIKQQRAEFRKNNKDKIKEYDRLKVVCCCGFEGNKNKLKRHQSTKRHHDLFRQKIYDFIWS